MTIYNFDAIIDRKNTGCLKYDFAKKRGRPADVLPFWVADMDFPIAEEISAALRSRLEHPVFGYSEATDGYYEAVVSWYEKHFGYSIKPEWITKTPGVVFALAMAVQAFTRPGDAVLLEQPVYYPFTEVIEDNGRRLVNVPLTRESGCYRMDYASIERAIAKESVKLLLLCSPHNPVGRVWEQDELKRLGDICLKHGVVIVSDEIHSDFVWDGNRHTVFASLGEKYAASSVICTAPSKTFNLAGLQISNIVIPDIKLRRAFRHAVSSAGYSQCNTFGLVACEAALRHGEPWLSQVKEYIYSNILFTRDYIEKFLPEIKLQIPQGTYLVWLDFSALGLNAKTRELWLWHKAKLWLDSGAIFGPSGESFERINVACPRALLLQGLEQLRLAVSSLKGTGI